MLTLVREQSARPRHAAKYISSAGNNSSRTELWGVCELCGFVLCFTTLSTSGRAVLYYLIGTKKPAQKSQNPDKQHCDVADSIADRLEREARMLAGREQVGLLQSFKLPQWSSNSPGQRGLGIFEPILQPRFDPE